MTLWRTLGFLCALILAQIVILALLGQPLISASGHIYLWAGDVKSVESSQQLFDWYTASHIIHGFIFYWLLRYFFPRLSFLQRLLMATSVEIGWEVLENTPWLIEHYREQALAQGYYGDSILNSVSDTLAAVLGFFLASRLPVYLSIALVLALEAFVGYQIRDNLTLNVVGLFHQFDVISRWQAGL